jgi:hypothetical protein
METPVVGWGDARGVSRAADEAARHTDFTQASRTQPGLRHAFFKHRESDRHRHTERSNAMLVSPLLRNPQLVRLGIRIDTAPAWWWPAAHFAAVGAAWLGTAHTLPGTIALVIAACTLWPLREQLRAAPRLEWLTLALLCTLACSVGGWLAAGWLGVAATLIAFVPGTQRAAVRLQLWQQLFGNTFVNRVAHKTLFAGTMLLCAAWSLIS